VHSAHNPADAGDDVGHTVGVQRDFPGQRERLLQPAAGCLRDLDAHPSTHFRGEHDAGLFVRRAAVFILDMLPRLAVSFLSTRKASPSLGNPSKRSITLSNKPQIRPTAAKHRA
jgi:hypothetical protein